MSIRLTTSLAVCREVALPALVLVLVLANGAVGANIFAAAPFKNYPVQLLTASVEAVSSSQNSVDDTDEQSVPEPPHFLEEAAANASPELATKSAYSPSVDSESINATSDSTGSVLIPASQIVVPEVSMQRGDERDIGDQCIDSYLWSLYLVTPKQDTIKVRALKKVTIKRNRERVAVFRSSSKSVDEDFSWKDPKAAQQSGRLLADYVIGGMDREFKLKLATLLRAAEVAGHSPGITSAFRDDFRQSIASGLKAASNRSYHGGSLRGGYGHGLAADIVSVNGATRSQRIVSSRIFWAWIDEHGGEYGIARPYLNKDPPHVGPSNGREYAEHRSFPKTSRGMIRISARQ